MCHLEIRTDRWQNRRFRPNSLVQVVYDRSLAPHAMDIENILSHRSSKKKKLYGADDQHIREEKASWRRERNRWCSNVVYTREAQLRQSEGQPALRICFQL